MKRVLFVVNWDWFFLSHRLPLALEARERGYQVLVATADTGLGQRIVEHGFEFYPLSLSPHGMNPVLELRSVAELAALYRRTRPDLLHHVTIKPVIYGSLAARTVPGTGVINAISGLGSMFSDRRGPWSRLMISSLYRIALRRKRTRIIFQNPDDLRRLTGVGMVANGNAILIRGSGVDPDEFPPRPEPAGPPLVILPARLLWEKGVSEFVEAARIVRRRRPDARLALVGAPDEGNPASVPRSDLERWAAEGAVEVWGHRQDMPEVMACAHIVALPSYYPEGVPRVLLEAAASERALIAADWPGSREVVQDGRTGVLVPPRDPAALAEAVLRLIDDPELRRRLARSARDLVLREFRVSLVVERTLDVYTELLRHHRDGIS
jgi:glycosyltransferase involved in cell wall biosynthesis